jgi:hypothetical protein
MQGQVVTGASSRHHPQPVGAIYQPEVAARAIAWAASHERRELYVGIPAAMTIILKLGGWARMADGGTEQKNGSGQRRSKRHKERVGWKQEQDATSA